MKNKNYITKYLIIILPLLFIHLNAQDQVDPLEKETVAEEDTVPFTVMSPAPISFSQARRDPSPDRARNRASTILPLSDDASSVIGSSGVVRQKLVLLFQDLFEIVLHIDQFLT